MDINKNSDSIIVVGAGVMGIGITQVFASAGYKVYLKDISQEFTQKGFTKAKAILDKQVKKDKISVEIYKKIIDNIKPVWDWPDCSDIKLVIEAIAEDMNIKKKMFSEIDKIFPKETIFTSNTSSLSITEMANSTKRKDRFLGLHFFNPAPVMKLVEITRGISTSDEVIRCINGVIEDIGKKGVKVKEAPGFIVNRMLCLMINEAIYTLMEDVATKEDIDIAMKLGANHPMGPLELCDLIGLDVELNVMETLYAEFKDPKYRPCPLLRKMVRGGLLGRKTNEGFYKYQ